MSTQNKLIKSLSRWALFILVLVLPGCSARPSSSTTSSGDIGGSSLSGSGTTAGSGSSTSASSKSGPFSSSAAQTGTTKSSQDMKTLATSMDKASAQFSDPSQAGAFKNLAQWARTTNADYQMLRGDFPIANLPGWLARRKAEMDKLKAIVAAAQKAKLDELVNTIQELSNRVDVFEASKELANGGFRFAYFRDPGLVAPYLNGYKFRGVAFQVYETAQKIGADTADLELSSCGFSATEEGQQAWLIYPQIDGCGPNTRIHKLGFIARKSTPKTTRELYSTFRSGETLDQWNTDFIDIFMIVGKQALTDLVPGLDAYHYHYNAATPVGYVN